MWYYTHDKELWRPLEEKQTMYSSSPYHHTVKELLVIQTAVLHAARLAQVVIRLRTLRQEVHVCNRQTPGRSHLELFHVFYNLNI